MEVKCATSFDERFDPASVLDHGKPQKFWMTTGLYPQELMIQFERPKSLSEVKFQTTGGKSQITLFLSEHADMSFFILYSPSSYYRRMQTSLQQ